MFLIGAKCAIASKAGGLRELGTPGTFLIKWGDRNSQVADLSLVSLLPLWEGRVISVSAFSEPEVKTVSILGIPPRDCRFLEFLSNVNVFTFQMVYLLTPSI